MALALLGTIAGCEGGSSHGEPVEQKAGAIYNGTLETTQSSGVIKLLRDNVFACSGDIVSQYWVITAARCINVADDTNGDGVIVSSENAARYSVSGGPDSNGALATFSAYQIVRHPSGVFSSGGTTDVAMIFVNPSSTGHSLQYIDPLKYTNGTLNLYQGSAAPLVGQSLLTYGFGAIGPSNADRGSRHYAWKTLLTVNQGVGYTGGLLNNNGALAGTSCDGDIGGPDFYWDGAKLNLLGIHSTTNDPTCLGINNSGAGGAPNLAASDYNSVAAAWRSWVASTASTCPAVTRSGRCHF
jgi:hypothetical protein